MKHSLVVGTKNEKKGAEIIELLPDVQTVSLADFPTAPNVEEDGTSFLENAAKKASTFARHLHRWVLGEDSGLQVDALNGAPGIYSARYAGEPCDDERNNDRLLAELAGVADHMRTARYICAAVVADPDGKICASAEGACEGRIAHRRQGTNGFGYDPLFFILEQGKTFGELPPEFKRNHSHRAAALKRLQPKILQLLQPHPPSIP